MDKLPDSQKSVSPQSGVDTRKGAFFRTVYTERFVKVYAVLESDLKNISMFNTLGTIFLSACTFCLATAITIIVTCATLNTPNDMSKLLLIWIMPLFSIMAVLFCALSIWSLCSKSSRWKDIGLNSKNIDSSVADSNPAHPNIESTSV